MRAEPRHIDIRQSLKQLKTATIVTAAIGRACYSEVPLVDIDCMTSFSPVPTATVREYLVREGRSSAVAMQERMA